MAFADVPALVATLRALAPTAGRDALIFTILTAVMCAARDINAVIGCARAVRLGLKAITYGLAPPNFYQVFRFSRSQAQSALAGCATLLFGVFDQTLYAVCYAGFEALSTAAIRATPLLAIMLIITIHLQRGSNPCRFVHPHSL